MSEVRLRACLQEAREAVDAGQFEQAVALARHVLQHHPACVAAYRLLGEACLERGDRQEAGELFQRVLSADPEDHLAWFGLAAVAEGEGRLEEATAYLERAFDLEPSKAGIRQELLRLYGRRGGARPARLRLTRAGLARILAHGGLYEQAIQEYEGVLPHAPDRLDLQVGLAEALWHHGRRIESAESCQRILERLPNCLKANLILGEIWRRAGRGSEAQRFLRRAESLDPLNDVAQEVLGRQSPLKPQDPVLPPVGVPRQVRPVTQAPPRPVEGAPEEVEEAPSLWPAVEEVPAAPHAEEMPPPAEIPVVETPKEAEELPPWLQALEPETGEPSPEWEGREAVVEEAREAAEALEEVPAWLEQVEEEEIAPPSPEETPRADVLAEATETPPQEPPLWTEPGRPGWLAEEPAARPEPEEFALPDWLQEEEEEPLPGALPEEVAGAAEPAEEAVEPIHEVPLEAEGVPDWLTELRRRAAAEEVLVEVAEAEEEAAETVETAIEVLEEAVGVRGEAEPPTPEEVVKAVAEVEAPAAEEALEILLQPQPEEAAAWAPAEIEGPAVEEVAEAEAPAGEATETALPVGEPPVPLPVAETVHPDIQAAQERLAVRPNDPVARLTLARACTAQGQLEQALSHYQHLVTVDEVLAQVVDDLEALAAREPGLAQTYHLLGDARMQQGKLNEALDAYRRALERLRR